MIRTPIPSLLVLVASAACGAAVLAAAQEAQFRTVNNSVSIFATVVDRNGRLVSDLPRDAFEIVDDGQPQPLTVFENSVQPITVVAMLDRSGSMSAHFALVRDAAEQFVTNLLPNDRARIGSFSNRIQIDPPTFTGDRNELIRILHEDLQTIGPTPLWNATSAAMTALAHEDGRRVILVFTDGQDTPTAGVNATFEDVSRRAQIEEVMVYAVGLSEECETTEARPRNFPYPGQPRYQRGGGRGGRGGPGPVGGGQRWPPIGRPGLPQPRLPEPSPFPGRGLPPRVASEPSDTAKCKSVGPDPDLRLLADVVGGGYFELHSTDDLRSTFARIADELHHQYLLGFTATTLDNRMHQIEVRVRRPGLTTRARRTYLAARN